MAKRLVLFVFCACLGWQAQARSEPRTHDGFYMQVSGGLGYYNSSAEAGGTEVSFSGLTVPASFFMGGTLIPGLTLGGGFFIDYGPSPAYEVNGQEQTTGIDLSQFVIGIGGLVDYYLDPAGGLHFQGFVGWGGLETSADGNVGGSDPTGLVTFIGAGYDWWIGDEWSVGVVARFIIAPISLNDVGYFTIEPSLAASITWH